MALDLGWDALDRRIDALRSGWGGYHNTVLARNRALLRAFSPEFDDRLGDFDQWTDPIKQSDDGHARNSYNIARAVPELWAALEASDVPAIRWQEPYAPLIPSLDPIENERRQTAHRAQRLVASVVATMREQALARHVRQAQLAYHFFRATVRKNVYGHSWTKLWPDKAAGRFRMVHKIDPSTVFPVYADGDDDQLDAVLVAYRKSAQSVNARYPEARIKMETDGITVASDGYYTPTPTASSERDRAFVWLEDYWTIDGGWTDESGSDEPPIRSLVVNALRVNGKMVRRTEYPGWTRLPYFLHHNDDERDTFGFSDTGSVMGINDGINRFLSQQQDVIHGESRPKFKHRGDADADIQIDDEGVLHLDRDEDFEQIAVHLDVFPTQVHGQQLYDILARVTGLSDTVWGRIAANSNSGRALATAWRAVAARMVPRTFDNTRTLMGQLRFMVDCMELYGWDNARELYQGNRDFEPDWPNQEPRDFTEVTLDAVNRLGAGIVDLKGAMELVGERSPDDMLERVRSDYVDSILHPEKGLSYLNMQALQQQMAMNEQQAAMAMADAQARLSGISAGNTAQAQQANTQAAQEAAPTLPPGQSAPATQAGAPANAGQAQTQVGTLVQNGGPAQSRIIQTRKF